MANYNYDFWSKEDEWKGGGMKDRALTGRAIDKTMAERRLLTDRTRAEQDRQLKRSIMNYNMGKSITKDMDDLNIKGDSGAGGFDAIVQQGSREMADYAAHLTKELQRTGDYASYSRAMSGLKAQVGDMRALKGDVTKFLTTANAMNEGGTLSNYVSADLRAAYMDMQSDEPNGSFQVIDGVQTWVGETVTGKPYKIASSEFKNITDRLVAKQDVNAILGGAMKVQTSTGGNILGFDEKARGLDGAEGMSAADFASNALKNAIDSKGPENRHRMAGALLTDNFGYTEEEAKNLLAGGWDGAYKILQQAWNDQARSQYGINSKAVNVEKRAQQTQYEQYKEKLDNRRDVQSTIDHLPLATHKNNDENDAISANYQFKGERENDPEKWSQDVKNSLVQKGFNTPKPLLENGGKPIMDLESPNGFRMPRVVGYEIINEKLPANRRTPVQLMFTDWDNMPNVWEKIYAATGVESFSAGAGFKDYTNDPLSQSQGRAQRITY